MFHRFRVIAITASVIAILLLSGCPNQGASAPAQIDRIGWVLENIDGDWWSTPSDQSAFFNFWVVFDHQGLLASDLYSVRITAPDGSYWFYDQTDIASDFDPDSGDFGGWHRCYSSDWDGGNYLLVGTYTVDVTFSNGSTVSKDILFPAPGSTTTGGYSMAYTEDSYLASTPSVAAISLPKRANITGGSLVSDTLTVDFSVDDSLIESGWSWFYNDENDIIGYSVDSFYDAESLMTSSTLNGGSNLLTDGSLNTLTYRGTNISFYDSYGYSDISTVVIVLIDGKQYPEENYYDARSISRRFVLP